MAREGITRAQVFNAADAISAAGQAPTVAGIRAKLGTGSYTTITALLREWKEQSISTERDDALDVPEEVTAALGRAAEIVWRAANDHFARELAAVRKEAERTAQQSAGELRDALMEVDSLEKLIDHRDALINEHEAEHTRLLEEQTKQSLESGAQLRTIAELRAELKAAHARIAEQSDLLRRLVPEGKPKAKTGAAPKRTKRPEAEPAKDTKTLPLAV